MTDFKRKKNICEIESHGNKKTLQLLLFCILSQYILNFAIKTSTFNLDKTNEQRALSFL